MDKKAIFKESIMRLLQLGISDKEVIDNLRGVGVDAETARVMLAETKRDMASGQKPGQESAASGQQVQDSGESESLVLPDDEDVYAKASEDEPEVPASKSGKSLVQEYTAGKTGAAHSDEDVSELWEKGVLATVDAKLNEMKRIRDDLDSVIDAKVQAKLKSESKKIETVLESQRSLFYSKIDAHLDQRAEELKQVLESNARGLGELNTRVQENIAKLQGEKKFTAELLNTLNERLTGLDTVKSQMISQTNTSLIGMESAFKEFMADSEKKRSEFEARLNSALELESKITEGLTEDLKQKIDSLRFEKEEQLTQKLQSRISEVDRLIAQVDSKAITEKISRMKELEQQVVARQKDLDSQYTRVIEGQRKYIDSNFADMKKEFAGFRKEIAKVQVDNLAELKKEYASNVDELFAENLVEWDKKLKEKKKEIDLLSAKVDIDKFNAAMESLDLFKQQFLNTLKKSIDDYNRSKKDLAESVIARDKVVTERIRQIDAKIKEFADFEKHFSSDVSELLEELQGARKAKQQGKRFTRSKPGDY